MSAIFVQPITQPRTEPTGTRAYDLLFLLEENHRNWFFDTATEMELAAGTTLVEENTPLQHLSVLIEGVLHVFHQSRPEKPIAVAGPGQSIGEMSFIEKLPASASVKAAERCMLLTIPFDTLHQKIKEDQSFKASFYGALLENMSGRLRMLTGKLNQFSTTTETPVNDTLTQAMSDFKSAVFHSNEFEIKRQEEAFKENAVLLADRFNNLVINLQENLGDNAPGTREQKDTIGYRMQQEMVPYLYMSNFMQRSYVKPRGYAGDYLTISNVYDDVAMGNGRTGVLLDRFALESPAVKAVKNRRNLLRDQIFRALENTEGTVHVTIFACGPARELFDVYAEMEDPSRLKATLIDIDLKALSHVMDEKERFGKPLPIELHQENLIYLALGRRQLNLPPQDLIYSIGLIDYFNDQLVVKLSDYAHQLLKPGGRVVFGNFHTSNPIKAFMDYILDWRLIHRDETDMDRLFESSKFATPTTEILFEEEQVNMFAICEKQGGV